MSSDDIRKNNLKALPERERRAAEDHNQRYARGLAEGKIKPIKSREGVDHKTSQVKYRDRDRGDSLLDVILFKVPLSPFATVIVAGGWLIVIITILVWWLNSQGIEFLPQNCAGC